MARNAVPPDPGGMSSTGRPRSSALPVLLLATMVIRSTRHDPPVVSDDADRTMGFTRSGSAPCSRVATPHLERCSNAPTASGSCTRAHCGERERSRPFRR